MKCLTKKKAAVSARTFMRDVPVSLHSNSGVPESYFEAFHALLASRALIRDALNLSMRPAGALRSSSSIPVCLRDGSTEVLDGRRRESQLILAHCAARKVPLESLTVHDLRAIVRAGVR